MVAISAVCINGAEAPNVTRDAAGKELVQCAASQARAVCAKP
jgi:hypothetical protein